jgi:BlaI family transcriptional regulator, penicillinase repressor
MDIAFTDRELDVMGVLWELGPSTVAEVQAALSVELAYTTVLTVLRTLEAKGHVAHDEEGRAHRYYPLVERAEAGASAVGRLVRKLFRGSPELLLTHLVAERGLTREQLEGIRALLDERIDDAQNPAGESGDQARSARSHSDNESSRSSVEEAQ